MRCVRDHWARLTDSISGIGIVVLAVTAVALALYGWLFLTAMLRQLTREQTQTAAAFAIAAALIGAIAVSRQTVASERRADDRRARRASALRAVLPLMLAAGRVAVWVRGAVGRSYRNRPPRPRTAVDCTHQARADPALSGKNLAGGHNQREQRKVCPPRQPDHWLDRCL